SGDTFMYASDTGQLDLFAARDVRSNALFTMLDSPTTQQPTPLFAQLVGLDLRDQTASARHIDDGTAVQVSAGRDIVSSSPFRLPKAAQFVAGRDIVDLVLNAQNLRPTDQTLVMAGRDIKFPQNTNGEIGVAGPGRLDVIAGRNVDL